MADKNEYTFLTTLYSTSKVASDIQECERRVGIVV